MISHIRIERFKCFEDTTIPFGKITLLAGVNGTGKSSTIQALLLLRQAFASGRLQEQELPLNGDMVRIGTAKDALFIDSREDVISFTVGAAEQPNTQYTWSFQYQRAYPQQYVLYGLTPAHKELAASGIFAPTFFYLMAERVGPRITYPMSELSDLTSHVGYQGEFTAHCLSKFVDKPLPIPQLALASEHEQKKPRLAHQTELWMREIVPDIEFDVKQLTRADLVSLGMRFSRQMDFLRPTNMGFGISYTLPIIVAALMAEPDTLFIVENPEAHLHPAAQSRLAQFLTQVAANGVQVILETHSDHILNGLRIAVKQSVIDPDDVALHYFYRREGQSSHDVTQLRIYKDGGIDRWPEGFFDQYEKDLEELF